MCNLLALMVCRLHRERERLQDVSESGGGSTGEGSCRNKPIKTGNKSDTEGKGEESQLQRMAELGF